MVTTRRNSHEERGKELQFDVQLARVLSPVDAVRDLG